METFLHFFIFIIGWIFIVGIGIVGLALVVFFFTWTIPAAIEIIKDFFNL